MQATYFHLILFLSDSYCVLISCLCLIDLLTARNVQSRDSDTQFKNQCGS